MKSIPLRWLAGCLLLMAVSIHGQSVSVGDAIAKGKELRSEGNYREAAAAVKPLLNSASGASAEQGTEALEIAVMSLTQIGQTDEAEQVIELAVTQFPKEWQVLLKAADMINGLPHYGMILEGKFRRGRQSHSGKWVNTQQRDRVRELQLLRAALKQLPKEAAIENRADILWRMVEVFRRDSSNANRAWQLLALTDLSKLPEYEGEEGMGYGSLAKGYPVDEKGEPVFIMSAKDWDSAINDGERMLWALAEIEKLDAPHATQALRVRAEIGKSWFSVKTLWNGVPGPKKDDEGNQKEGIMTLHTLADDETVSMYATGPKRVKLPAEWAFIKLHQAVAENATLSKDVRIASLDIIAQELTNRRQYKRAVEAYNKALALAGDDDKARIQLEKQIAQITGNWGRFESLLPHPKGQEAKLQLVFRNAKTIDLTAQKVNVTKLLADVEAYIRSGPQNLDWQKVDINHIGRRLLDGREGKKYLIDIRHRWKQELKPKENHWDRRVEVPTPLKEAGAWLIEGTFEGGNKARTLIWIEDLVIVKSPQKERAHYFIADAVTGAPISGAKVRFFGYRSEWKDGGTGNRKPRIVYAYKDVQAVSDDTGSVTLTADNATYQWLIQATTADGRNAYLGFAEIFSGRVYEDFAEQPRLYTITDRPVYRPGQEVKWKGWVRKVSYDPKVNTNAFAGKQFRVTITDPRGEKVAEKTYTSDDSGALDDVLVLSDDATLGNYAMSFVQIKGGRADEHIGSHQFRVEEYKKPEFEVKVDAPTSPVALGDSFEITVSANYYFGGPVKEGKVKYKVQRSTHANRWFPVGPWDWLFGSGYNWHPTYYQWYPGFRFWSTCIPRWPWMPWRTDPPELVAQGEAAIGADGTFKVKIDTALAKELHGDEDHRYEIEAEVTDNSRRTIYGKGSVLAARRPFEVYVWLDRGYYQAGESGIIRVAARTLDGKEVKAAGSIKLLQVTYDESGKPNEKEVQSFEIRTGDEEFKQTVKWAASGQYRIAVPLKDEAGHEIEGTAFVIVRGEGFAEGKDFRFDDLEVIVQKDEYAPGEEVELSINTNHPGSTVALFVRTQDGIYPDPIWLRLNDKSTTYNFRLGDNDQPNIFVEAFTVSDARIHSVTKQIIVPPKKRIATVELEPDHTTYQPAQGAKVKVRVKDQDGKPFEGKVVLTAYDKALEYISGGSNQSDMKTLFWGWKRNHQSESQHSLRPGEIGLWKEGEDLMIDFGNLAGVGLPEDNTYPNRGRSAAVGGLISRNSLEAFGRRPMLAMAPAPVAAYDAVAESASAKSAGTSGEDEGPQPMIRSNLADSAVWIADLTTDATGYAELNFDLPDNLTTWKLRSWVMGPQTQVGEADVEVVTRKNVMVRLQAPRFFVEKDEVVLSANVHNETDEGQSIKAVLELEGGVLELVEGEKATLSGVKVAAHSETRFDWRVRVKGEGEAKVRVKALGQKDGDAMEMTFPAYTHGILKTDSWSLALRPEMEVGKLKIRVPEERKPEQSRLEVRYTPTLAMALVDALPYLVDYPYGCTEQTLNRFVPTVVTLGVLKTLGVDLKAVRDKKVNLNAQEIGNAEKRGKRWQGGDRDGNPKQPVFDEDEVKKMAATGLERLTNMRNNDGGWGWFPGGEKSSPHITTVVLHGLHAAEKAGMDVNDGVIRSAVNWLKNHEAESLRRLRLPDDHREHKAIPDNLDALIHCVLVEHKAGNADMRARLYEKRAHLSHYNLALLGLACHQLREFERRDMCLRNLKQFLKQDDENQTAYLELAPGGYWWFWYEDRIETQAAFLRLLVATEPKGELASRVAKYLLNNRRNGTYWNSTKDTAAVIEALAEYIKASGESKPNLTVEVVLNGEIKKSVKITPETLFTFDNTFTLEGDDVATGEHTVELRKKGEAPLYANAYLTVFSQEDMIPAAGLEVKARRRFYKLIEEKPKQQVAGSRGQVVTQTGFKYRREEIVSDAEIKSGDLIEVELSIESKNDYEYVLIEDMKPAGFEPVEVQSGWNRKGLAAYKEYRDEKVAFFADRLPRGIHNLSYRVKAEIPGRFSALPTKVEAMYAPELRGNAQEWKIRIGE